MTDRLTLMAVHAHPDDECIGTGGVLARYSAEGVRTVLVTATRGEEGEIVDPEMQAEEVRPKLGDVRVEELRCACMELGVTEFHVLGYRDSGMAGTPANNHPECLAQADCHEATGRLVIEHFLELDDVLMRRESTQRLDFAQVVDLVDALKVVLHALDGMVLAVLDILGLEHLGERAFALLGNQTVLAHGVA